MAGHGTSSFQPQNKTVRWIDSRLPLFSLAHEQAIAFPTPKNLNYMWTFGAILMFMLITMILTGITLAMHYAANTELAFNQVEHIMRDVNYGWLLRYIHAVGASMFFFAVYMHIARGLYYGSYKAPREILWMLGVIILILMMATAFMGYVLPWGQMSGWGATVITNLFSAIPLVGPAIVEWLWGGFAVDNPTLNRFFALHYLLPFMIAGIVFLHVWALHISGNNNPTGVSVKSAKDTVSFHPYVTMKDVFALVCFMLLYGYFVFYAPNYLGHPDNYIEFNPLATPAHIVPEWYLLPFYAILRAIPSKLGGVIAMFSALLVLFVVPWLDTSKVRSAKYRPMFKIAFWLFVVTAVALGWLGAQPAEGVYIVLARIFTAYYFGFFLVLMPVLGLIEKPKPMPNSISEAVLHKDDGLPNAQDQNWIWGGKRQRGRNLPRVAGEPAAGAPTQPGSANAAQKD
ncbi:cytochrome b N-terminal domain-containing protein [Acuticoccus sp. MNP-M23]|uniref:cytochrome b n=1 Tax=Acuticoccus sp. MNP-M23 TaxID=3072793 RepID=UPI002816596A|nr:cytochrome b N-terminal domain-containing protein [Acuticoccus sp. MNP-M23]WMS41065.1 cytochrome b N-terminal domain-containing protein [Acuticoccus sp. MNP-M23]